jgi:hypothetical protein
MAITIQRYAKRSADNYPYLEVSKWEQPGAAGIPAGDPRAVPLEGREGEWVAVSVSGAIADTSGLFTQAQVDPITGEVLDPGGQPTTEHGLSDLFTLPLRDGLVEIDRAEFETLWPPPEEGTEVIDDAQADAQPPAQATTAHTPPRGRSRR